MDALPDELLAEQLEKAEKEAQLCTKRAEKVSVLPVIPMGSELPKAGEIGEAGLLDVVDNGEKGIESEQGKPKAIEPVRARPVIPIVIKTASRYNIKRKTNLRETTVLPNDIEEGQISYAPHTVDEAMDMTDASTSAKKRKKAASRVTSPSPQTSDAASNVVTVQVPEAICARVTPAPAALEDIPSKSIRVAPSTSVTATSDAATACDTQAEPPRCTGVTNSTPSVRRSARKKRVVVDPLQPVVDILEAPPPVEADPEPSSPINPSPQPVQPMTLNDVPGDYHLDQSGSEPKDPSQPIVTAQIIEAEEMQARHVRSDPMQRPTQPIINTNDFINAIKRPPGRLPHTPTRKPKTYGSKPSRQKLLPSRHEKLTPEPGHEFVQDVLPANMRTTIVNRGSSPPSQNVDVSWGAYSQAKRTLVEEGESEQESDPEEDKRPRKKSHKRTKHPKRFDADQRLSERVAEVDQDALIEEARQAKGRVPLGQVFRVEGEEDGMLHVSVAVRTDEADKEQDDDKENQGSRRRHLELPAQPRGPFDSRVDHRMPPKRKYTSDSSSDDDDVLVTPESRPSSTTRTLVLSKSSTAETRFNT
jgi:hypothetical protein